MVIVQVLSAPASFVLCFVNSIALCGIGLCCVLVGCLLTSRVAPRDKDNNGGGGGGSLERDKERGGRGRRPRVSKRLAAMSNSRNALYEEPVVLFCHR